MLYSLSDLRSKEVIDIKSGVKLGFVDDVELNMEAATVAALVVYGRPRFFGLFGRDEDMLIRCRDISVIGEDTILVEMTEDSGEELQKKTKNRRFHLENLFK